jgi:hypothetical protein
MGKFITHISDVACYTCVRELCGTAWLLMCQHELAGKGLLTVSFCMIQSSVQIVIFEVTVLT